MRTNVSPNAWNGYSAPLGQNMLQIFIPNSQPQEMFHFVLVKRVQFWDDWVGFVKTNQFGIEQSAELVRDVEDMKLALNMNGRRVLNFLYSFLTPCVDPIICDIDPILCEIIQNLPLPTKYGSMDRCDLSHYLKKSTSAICKFPPENVPYQFRRSWPERYVCMHDQIWRFLEDCKDTVVEISEGQENTKLLNLFDSLKKEVRDVCVGKAVCANEILNVRANEVFLDD